MQSKDNSSPAQYLTGETWLNIPQLHSAIYSQTNGGGASTILSRKTKPEKASYHELLIAIWNIKSSLENMTVKDENHKPYPVLHLFMLIDGYSSFPCRAYIIVPACFPLDIPNDSH